MEKSLAMQDSAALTMAKDNYLNNFPVANNLNVVEWNLVDN